MWLKKKNIYIYKVLVDSSHLLAETEGPQEGIHIIKLGIAEALQPLWVTGLSRQTHCTDLERKRVSQKENKKMKQRNSTVSLT